MSSAEPSVPVQGERDAVSVGDLLDVLKQRWRALAAITIAAGAIGVAVALLLPPTFTARATIMPPQQQSSAAASALSSLGALAGLGSVPKSPSEQYVALMESVTVRDRIINQFKLREVYGNEYMMDARRRLEKNVSIASDKKSGLITIDVDDHDPGRAAAMANAFVDNLRFMANNLAVTEAQQRRRFFEVKLKDTQTDLTRAQLALQSSGYNAGAIKMQPQVAADAYARLQADVAAAEVRLQSMSSSLASTSPEVRQQQALLGALRAQLSTLEKSSRPGAGDAPADAKDNTDYVSKLRDFKYQETLFDLFTRQYESARLDESREGTLIQVVDAATPPEHKSKPSRVLIVLAALAAGFVLGALWLLVRRPRAD